MNNIYKIPNTVQTFEAGDPPKSQPVGTQLVYNPTPDERILVTYWVQYPSYDFIFGVPDRYSPRYEKEVGFFQFRDSRAEKIRGGMYIDCSEIEDMIKGLQATVEKSKEVNPDIWQKRRQ